MKQFLFLTCFSLALVQISPAASCVSGTLASYVALGAGGCTIGGDTLANFKDLPGTGATELGASAVSIMPIGGTFNPGLSATINVTAMNGVVDEAMFTYTISGATFNSDSVTLSNSSESGGQVYEAQNYCAGGTFGTNGVTGCNGATSGTLATLDGILNKDSAALANPHLLSVTEDLFVDSTLGDAMGATITDQFTAVPEPAAPLITGLGLVSLAWAKSRFRTAARSKDKGVNQ